MALPQRKYEEEQSPNTYQYQVRNAKKIDKKRLNTDFQYLNKEEFSDKNTDPRLLSSQNPTLRNQKTSGSKTAANDAQYHPPATSHRMGPPTGLIRQRMISRGTTKTIYKRAKATFVSASIVTWGMTLWIIQVIFALVSTVFLGLLGAGDTVMTSNFITRGLGWAINRATEGATWLISGTAISISDMSAGMFMAMYMIAFAIGMITLMAANLQYMMSLLHPMSGANTSMKYGAFLIAALGYATPLLNLFPWFLVFVAVVWKYPK